MQSVEGGLLLSVQLPDGIFLCTVAPFSLHPAVSVDVSHEGLDFLRTLPRWKVGKVDFLPWQDRQHANCLKGRRVRGPIGWSYGLSWSALRGKSLESVSGVQQI